MEEIEKAEVSDIINLSDTKEAADVHTVGKIDREIYKCITENIVTDEVIITDNQVHHIKERHPNDDSEYKNSVITFMKINFKEWNRLLRNKKIFYKRE